MQTTISALLGAAFGVTLAFAATSPGTAAPAAPIGAEATAAVMPATPIAARKKKHRRQTVHSRSRQAPRAYRQSDRGWRGPAYERGPAYDNVGSVGQDGYGYGYNRFSGQRYQSCVFDEGYGRTRPCDAGDGGGGRD